MADNEVEELTRVDEKEERRRRLRNKINSKKTNRTGGFTRKQSQTLSDKIEKLVEFLKTENITVNSPITETIIEKVTAILSKNEMRQILSKVRDNPEVNENFNIFLENMLKTQ